MMQFTFTDISFLFICILLTIMFLISGIKKITSFDEYVVILNNQLTSSLNIQSSKLSFVGIVFAIILLIVGPILILSGVIFSSPILITIGSILLLVFMLLATGLFYLPVTDKNFNNFMSHLTIIGGLSLLLYHSLLNM